MTFTFVCRNTTDENGVCDDLWISGCTHYIVIRISVVCVHDAVYKPPMYTYIYVYIYMCVYIYIHEQCICMSIYLHDIYYVCIYIYIYIIYMSIYKYMYKRIKLRLL